MTKSTIPTLWLSILVLLCVSSLGLGQGTTSRVAGTVQDANGGALVGVTVTLTNEASGVSFTTETGDGGAYSFDLVPAGNYSVAVERQGFKKALSKGNAANVNQPAIVNVVLEPGAVTESVTVIASAEQVQTGTSGNIGSTIEQRTLESLPIVGTRGRNPLDLLNFQPGVVFGGNTGGAVNVNGSRDRAFNFTLDGIDINESTAGGSNFTPLRPNPDSVQEFQVVTSNFTAELGRSSGAQVTLVTRSGTNQFHGNFFEYYRSPRFDAKSYPVTIAGLPKDQFVQHIFGGSLGGPLFDPGFGEGGKGFRWLRDKAFFFTNLQLLRAYDTALVARTVYTQAARQGLFRYVVGRANSPAGTTTASVDAGGNPILPACNATPPTNAPCISSYNIATNPTGIGIDPTLAGVINSMPLPNNFTGGDGLNTAVFNFASPQHEKQYDFVTKLDFKLRENSLLYVRYAQGSQTSLGDSANAGRPVFPGSPNFVDTSRTPKNLAVNWRWSPTATVTNEAIFGISKFFFTFATPNPDPNLPFVFLNPATPNTNFSYNARGVRTLQFIDNLTFVKGSHTLKAGTNLRFGRHTDDRSNVAGSAIEPVVTFSGAAGFTGFGLPTASATSINTNDLTRLQNTIVDELGRIGSVSQAFVLDPSNPSAFAPAGTRWLNTASYPELDFYFQDNWRFSSNLVFDLGLRWEAKLNPNVEGRPILIPNQPVKLGAAPSNTLTWVDGDVFKNANVLMPSVGFAWDPFKSGKTSIRGNYRIASDRIATFLFGSSIFQSTPGNNVAATNSTFGQGGGLYRNLAPVIAGLAPTSTPSSLRQPPPFGTGSISVMDPDLEFPQVHEWSLSFQREIGKNVVEVNYIGKHAVHLLGGYNVNQVNVFASVAGVSETSFLDAFNRIRASGTYNSPLINLIMSGNAANNGGTARFRALNTTAITQGGAASAALVTSQRTCQAADVSAGICTNAQLNRRLLDVNGFTYLLQPYPQFTGGLNVFDSSDYSNYGGLQLIFKRRISSGLGFQFGYTFSTSKDNRSWDPSLSTVSTGSVQSASSTPFDLRDRSLNYTWSDFDRRHVFQGTYTYELPLGRGKAWASDVPKIVDHIIGGWQLAGTVILMSGRPFTVYSGINTVSNVVQSTSDCSGCSRDSGQLVLESGRNFWFDAPTRALFTAPAPGSIGNTGRNFFVAPKYFQWDASLLKKFKVTERVNFDLRVDARNVLNNPSFDNPTALITSAIFGRINDTVTNNARRIQLSGKISF
ncbi:MAG: Plug and carboxypeptidase regulatory-like domain-containing protein [Pyrinomonadaceae bacterium]|nr:Plug and carboxypeptidase regulatory-like domain-containing protein [Pyrinomonadaceae bacterium]